MTGGRPGRVVATAPSLRAAVGWHATRHPAETAVFDGDLRWSWADLASAADSAARALAAAGIGEDGRVALVAGPSAGAIATLHGAIRLAATVATLDPRLAAPELTALLDASGASVVVTGEPAAIPPGATRSTLALPGPTGGGMGAIDSTAGLPDSTMAGSPEGRESGRTATFLVPTSGTTGAPKLVRLGLTAVEASAGAWSAILPPATGWMLSLGLAHVAGLGIVARAALAGVPVVVPAGPGTDAILNALSAAAAGDAPVSHLSLVAVQLERLLDATPEGPPAGIRAVLLGGGPIPASLVVRARRSGWPVIPSYGMTETASGVVAMPLAEVAHAPGLAGRPLPGVELRIAGRSIAGDRADDEDDAGDGSGEIELRGAMLFDGYDGDAAASAAAITRDGWLRTGDLGRLDADGRLEVLDRLDDVVVTGGEKVAPAQVEAVLLDHPAVAEAAVVGVPDATWGAVPVAAVVPRADVDADGPTLRTFVRERLAAFRVPARIAFVAGLPRRDGGKLRRRDLAALVDLPPLAVVDRPGPGGAPVVMLLHATLSSAAQLAPLVERLGPPARVLAVDRRGSGRSPMATPRPLPLAAHVADLIAVLDAAAVERAVVVGHSFGGVVALELAARHPERVAGVLAWEPPYLALAEPGVRISMAGLADAVAVAHEAGGPAAAAEVFYGAVAGADAWRHLHPRQRAALARGGDGVLADVSMPDLVPDALGRIAAPVVLATGGRSDPLYAPIADALAARIEMARVVCLPDLRHPAPITDPDPIAELVRALLAQMTAPDAPSRAILEETG